MLAAMASIYADARANVCGRVFPFSLKNLPFPKKFFFYLLRYFLLQSL